MKKMIIIPIQNTRRERCVKKGGVERGIHPSLSVGASLSGNRGKFITDWHEEIWNCDDRKAESFARGSIDIEFLEPISCNIPYRAKSKLLSVDEKDIHVAAWIEDRNGQVY